MMSRNRILYFTYYLIIFFLVFEILFAKKNAFTVFENFENITNEKQLLSSKIKELDDYNRFIKNFESIEEFQRIIIKDKLFYKEDNEIILRY